MAAVAANASTHVCFLQHFSRSRSLSSVNSMNSRSPQKMMKANAINGYDITAMNVQRYFFTTDISHSPSGVSLSRQSSSAARKQSSQYGISLTRQTISFSFPHFPHLQITSCSPFFFRENRSHHRSIRSHSR